MVELNSGSRKQLGLEARTPLRHHRLRPRECALSCARLHIAMWRSGAATQALLTNPLARRNRAAHQLPMPGYVGVERVIAVSWPIVRRCVASPLVKDRLDQHSPFRIEVAAPLARRARKQFAQDGTVFDPAMAGKPDVAQHPGVFNLDDLVVGRLAHQERNGPVFTAGVAASMSWTSAGRDRCRSCCGSCMSTWCGPPPRCSPSGSALAVATSTTAAKVIGTEAIQL